MGLRNVLLVVSDIEKSREFYHELFGLMVVRDFGENVMLTEGLVLQERASWEELIGERARGGNASELYFEVGDFDDFLRKVSDLHINVLCEPGVNSWGKRCVRLADPDGHLIEVVEGL